MHNEELILDTENVRSCRSILPILFCCFFLDMFQINTVYSPQKLCIFMMLGGFIMGMDVTSLIVFIESQHFKDFFGMPNPLEQGVLIGSNCLGSLVGCIIYAMLVSRSSRISLFRVSCSFWVSGSIIGVTSVYLWMVILSRCLKGITVGIFSILIAAYTGEVFPKEKKGRIMALVQVAYTSAILMFYYACAGIASSKSVYSFRIIWAIEIIPILCLWVGTCWLPESPQLLTLKGDYAKAEDVHNNLAKAFTKAWGNVYMKPTSKLQLVCRYGNGINNFKYTELASRYYWRQVMMGITLQMLVQVSGINILMYYIIYICDMIGLTGKAKAVSASVPYLISLILSLLPIIYLDFLRRKQITLMGSFPLAFIMLVIGILMAVSGKEVAPINGNKTLIWQMDPQKGSYILGLCFLFVAVFSLTLSSGPWMYTNEILPTRAKPKGFAICMLTGWTSNFILTLLGPLMLAKLKWGTFILLGGLTFVISVCILICFPETRDMSIEQIDQLYGFPELEESDEKDVEPRQENAVLRNGGEHQRPIEMKEIEEP